LTVLTVRRRAADKPSRVQSSQFFGPHAAMLLRGMAFRAAVRYFSTGRPPKNSTRFYSFLGVEGPISFVSGHCTGMLTGDPAIQAALT
jgi:hypothetical protein